MSDLVGNPEDRFSRVAAHLIHVMRIRIIVFWISDLGPVVESIVSLTISLRHEFVKQISAKVTNTQLFFVEKM